MIFIDSLQSMCSFKGGFLNRYMEQLGSFAKQFSSLFDLFFALLMLFSRIEKVVSTIESIPEVEWDFEGIHYSSVLVCVGRLKFLLLAWYTTFIFMYIHCFLLFLMPCENLFRPP